MDFRIADTFTDSLARLTGEEQKAAKTTAFDLQLNPASPGMSFHKLDKARDKNFWSVRVSGSIRLIVHKTNGSLLLCYVDHHDKAYDWAERRKLETHPTTGAAQLVEIRETVKEVVIPVYRQEELPLPSKPILFAGKTDEELLSYGVPPEWLNDVRQADEDSLLVLAERLPGEAAEALLELATGGKPRIALPHLEKVDPFDHPDAQRRFRVMANVEELSLALDFPWEKWTIFLHPEQRELVDRDYSGPARVSGSAGTGKTIVALHRAVHLARKHPEARVLLATFSEPLARALGNKLRRLVGAEPRLAERIDVHSLDAFADRLFKAQFRQLRIAEKPKVADIIANAAKKAGSTFTRHFLTTEWDQVVDAWQLRTWEGYRDVARLGRKTRLPETHRKTLWAIFEQVGAALDDGALVTRSGAYCRLAAALADGGSRSFDFAVIDESQDLTISQLKFLAALGGGRPDALFFAGDLGQRIFQQPFSWKSLGVDIRGRSRQLRINYRTSHQIRQQADRLLGPELSDVDGIQENRSDTISVFNGPSPEISVEKSEEAEASTVGEWLSARSKEGILPHEMAVFVRSPEQIERAKSAITRNTDLPCTVLDEQIEPRNGHIAIGTMHLAKGLEFRAVAVMACDDEVIPLQSRIETIGDESDLQDIYDTERQLLYVACTRARDRLLITATSPASEFLDDLRGK